MISFLTTLLERAAGPLAGGIRPVVPSMFESPVTPFETRQEGIEESQVLSPMMSIREPSEMQPIVQGSPLQDTKYPEERQDVSQDIGPIRSPTVTSVNTRPDGDQQWQPSIGPSHFDPPQLWPATMRPLATVSGREGEPARPTTPALPNPQEESPSPSTRTGSLNLDVDALKSRIDELANRFLLRNSPSSELAEVTAPVLPSMIHPASRSDRDFAPGRHIAPLPPELDRVVSQQQVPEIQVPREAAAPPSVTVSIGRIEFRNTTRRTETPAAPPPVRPASRIVSLEDYLRTRSAGGS